MLKKSKERSAFFSEIRLKSCALILAVSLFISTVYSAPVFAGELETEEQQGIETGKQQEINPYLILVVSEEIGTKELPVCEIDGKFYMDIMELCAMTRTQVAKHETSVSMVQGEYRVELDLEDGLLSDSIGNSWEYNAHVINDTVLVEAVPFLYFWGAVCELSGQALIINMPMYTFWEVYDPNYRSYYVSSGLLFGEEWMLDVSLTCDLISEMIFNSGLLTSTEKIMQDALFCMLDTNVMTYDGAAKEAEKQGVQTVENMKKVDLEKVTKYTKSTMGTAADTVADLTKDKRKIISLQRDSKLAQLDKLSGFEDEYSDIKKTATDLTNKKKKLKKGSNIADGVGIGLEVLGVIVNTVLTTQKILNYSYDTLTVINDALGEENIKYAKVSTDDVFCYDDARNVSEYINSKDVDQKTLFKEGLSAIAAEFADLAWSELLNITAGSIVGLAYSVGVLVTSIVCADSIEAYHADLMAAYLLDAEHDGYIISEKLQHRAETESFGTYETIVRFVNTQKFYYRTITAILSQYTVSLEEFGNANKYDWINYFSKCSDYYAKMVYMYTNCTVVECIDPMEYEDDILASHLDTSELEPAELNKDSDADAPEVNRILPTSYDSSTMEYMRVCACDENYEFYKDSFGDLMRTNRDGSVGRMTLFMSEFVSICGIDESYIYITTDAQNGEGYDIIGINKETGAEHTVVSDIKNLLLMNEGSFFYTLNDKPNVIMRVSRETLKSESFAVFEHDVDLMTEQDDKYYVLAKKDSPLAFLFGAEVYNYYINKQGELISSLGTSPEPEDLPKVSGDSYTESTRYISNGYLRTTAEAVYIRLTDGSYYETQTKSGWNNEDSLGIIVTLDNRNESSSTPFEIAYYCNGSDTPKHLTEVWSNQAFFTLCKASDGTWYFFDQKDRLLTLYRLVGSSKEVVKEFELSEMRCDLNDCGMDIMNNKIFFYRMTDEKHCDALYRYNVFIWEGVDTIVVA